MLDSLLDLGDKTSQSFEAREGGPERWSEGLKPDFLVPSFKDVTLSKLLDGLKVLIFRRQSIPWMLWRRTGSIHTLSICR